MADFCVYPPPRCGVSGVSTLRIFAGGGPGACGTDMLKMVTSCLSATVCFSHGFGMGMDGVRF